MKIISNLQNKSERQKRTIALFLAGVITLIIFSLWTLNFSRKISVSSDRGERTTKKIVSPISTLMGTFDIAVDEVSGIFGKIKETVDNI